MKDHHYRAGKTLALTETFDPAPWRRCAGPNAVGDARRGMGKGIVYTPYQASPRHVEAVQLASVARSIHANGNVTTIGASAQRLRAKYLAKRV